MDLSCSIEFYAGGPGSGCNPAAGKCGRDKVFTQGPTGDWAKDYRAGNIEHRMVPVNSLRGFPKVGGEWMTRQGLQEVNPKTVTRRANEMTKGKKFSPPVVLQRGDRHHVLDGMHRAAAFRKAFPGEKNIHVLVVTDKGRSKILKEAGKAGS
jgi:hypothetical protein